MTTRLEQRYRLALRLLPASYRRRWEDDMVTAYLESRGGLESVESLESRDADDPDPIEPPLDDRWPSLTEVASIASLAVTLRLGGLSAPPRSYAWGQAVRLAALMALLANAVLITAGLLVELWLLSKIPWAPAPSPALALTPPSGLWSTAWQLASYAWLPAYLALVLGHRRIAQGIALLAVAPPAITTAVTQATGAAPLLWSPWVILLVNILLLIAMAAFHRDAPPVPRRPWLLALPAGILLVPLPLVALQITNPALGMLDWPGLACVVVTAACLVHLAGLTRSAGLTCSAGEAVSPGEASGWVSGEVRLTSQAAGRVPGQPARLTWSLALTLLATTTLAVRVATLPDNALQADHGLLNTVAALEMTALLLVGVPLAVLAARALRQLPPDPPGSG